MTKKDVKRAIDDIEPSIMLKGDVYEAVRTAKPVSFKKRKIWISAVATVLVLCVAITGIFRRILWKL